MTNACFEQDAPKGYEFTGEFRVPREGEEYCVPGDRTSHVFWSGHGGARRLILRKSEHVVQVNVYGYTAHYAYSDPSGMLRTGDVVEVPFGVGNEPRIGIVIGMGRTGYKGPLKTVAARMIRQEL